MKKYLIIDKKQKINSQKKFTYATLRIMDELKIKNIEFDFLHIDQIEIIYEKSKLKILGNGTDLSEYSNILLRGHSLENHKEYETKALIVNYIEQINTNKGTEHTKVQNSRAIRILPYYNKIWMQTICSKNNIPVFDSYYRLDGDYIMKRDYLQNFPLIIKEYSGANKVQVQEGKEKIKKNVYKLESIEDLNEEFSKDKDLKNYFLQEFSDAGEDIRIFVSKGKVIGGWKRKATKNFMTVSEGEYSIYDNPAQEIKELAERTAKAFEADFIATDFMFNNDKPYLQEISFNPGFKAYETKAIGKNPANIAKYIVESF
jgi:glutathione synthase/RimK-type ligase-like ATP-grasp enzyme